jgi:hypothetical protein
MGKLNINKKKLIQKNWVISLINIMLILSSFLLLICLNLYVIASDLFEIQIMLKYRYLFIDYKLFELLTFFYKILLNNLLIVILFFLILIINYIIDYSKIANQFNIFISKDYWNILLFSIIIFIISLNFLWHMTLINEALLNPSNFKKIIVYNPIVKIEQIFTLNDILFFMEQYLKKETYEVSSHLNDVFKAALANPSFVKEFIHALNLNDNLKTFNLLLDGLKEMVVKVHSQNYVYNITLYRQLCDVDIIEWKKLYTFDQFNEDKIFVINFQNLVMNNFLDKTEDINDIIFPNVVYFTQIFNETFDILEFDPTLASKQDWNMYYKALKNIHLYITETHKFHENCWTIELIHKYQYMNYHIQLTDPNIFDKIHNFLNEWTNNNSNINKKVIITEEELLKKINEKTMKVLMNNFSKISDQFDIKKNIAKQINFNEINLNFNEINLNEED